MLNIKASLIKLMTQMPCVCLFSCTFLDKIAPRGVFNTACPGVHTKTLSLFTPLACQTRTSFFCNNTDWLPLWHKDISHNIFCCVALKKDSHTGFESQKPFVFVIFHIWVYTIICLVGIKSGVFASWGLMKASSVDEKRWEFLYINPMNRWYIWREWLSVDSAVFEVWNTKWSFTWSLWPAGLLDDYFGCWRTPSLSTNDSLHNTLLPF